MDGRQTSYAIDRAALKAHNISTDAVAGEYRTGKQELMALYKKMLDIRLMEERLESLYRQKKIRGFCHLSIGQEGIYAALWRVVDDDKVIASYRCHGAAYATGCTIKEIVCENLGLIDGNCGGKGGSMHLYNDKFYGGHGIVGAQVPLGTGIAFAIKYKMINKNMKDGTDSDWKAVASDSVVFTLYGDGASNQGQVYESFNMAKVYNLPVVFICENNKYGMYTPVESVSVDDNFYMRGYGIPGLRTTDSDIFLLVETLRFAKSYAKARGPIIVQIDTNRKCGHSTLDEAQLYRKKNDVFVDCLDTFEALCRDAIGDAEFKDFKDRIITDFDHVMENIDYKNFPGEKELYTDIV